MWVQAEETSRRRQAPFADWSCAKIALGLHETTMEGPMANVILTYKLKPGVAREEFETWVRDWDYPKIRGVKRIASMVNHRVERLLLGEGSPSVDYVEIFDIPDLDTFLAEDMAGPAIQEAMAEFMNRADNAEFLVVSPIV
jgi:hypothetical protein